MQGHLEWSGIMHRSHGLLLLLGIGMGVMSCAQQPASAPAQPAAADRTDAVPVAPVSAAAGAAAPAPAPVKDQVLIDFRGRWWDTPEIAAAEVQRLKRLIDPAAPAEADITSRVDGAFTAPGARQQALMPVPEGASTIVPFPAPATLAIVEGDRVVARHRFSRDDGSLQWVRKAADVDGDGIDEVLLTGGTLQMGEQLTWAVVANMSGGDYRVLQEFAKASDDTCDAHDGDRSKGRVEAAVIAVEGGRLVEHRSRAACTSKRDAQGNYPEPAQGDFKPLH